MEADSVYVKTLQGREEVRLRSRRLSARERTTLIMIDGKRRVAELRMMSPSPSEVGRHLQTFLDTGLIAPLQHSAVHEAASSTALPVSQAAFAQSLQEDADLEKARQYILEVAEETLGADSTAFTDKLLLLDNTQELLNLAQHLRDVLYRFTNTKEADQFLQTVREIAPKA